jgi:hypothetical protein
LVFDGEFEHAEALGGGGCGDVVLFVGGEVGGDEEDLVGVEEFAGAAAGDEVAVMDGVEGAAIE